MHPSSTCSLMSPLACAVSLGLLITATPLGVSAALQSYAEANLSATTGAEDDRGSGRLSRVPAIATKLSLRGSGRVNPAPPTNQLSFRGSGRVKPTPPTSSAARPAPLAYRGSGRIAAPGTTNT